MMIGKEVKIQIEEIPMAKQSGNGEFWLKVAAIAIVVLTLVMCAVIMLVLTGIIAEPETVFNNIGKIIFGK